MEFCNILVKAVVFNFLQPSVSPYHKSAFPCVLIERPFVPHRQQCCISVNLELPCILMRSFEIGIRCGRKGTGVAMKGIFRRHSVLSALFSPFVGSYLSENALCRNTLNASLSLCSTKRTFIQRHIPRLQGKAGFRTYLLKFTIFPS